jgi:GTPase
MIGVLSQGKLDDGRGKLRTVVFNHKHEHQTGRTSSIGQQIVGFDDKGVCVNHTFEHSFTWGDIIEKSFKIISFLDLAGHEKYIKIAVEGMTGHMPDYCLLLVGSNMGVTIMTKEHFGIAMGLKIPLLVVITKIDLCPENVLKQTLADVQYLLKKGRKTPFIVRTKDDMITVIKNFSNDRVVPIILVSNVSGENLDLLRMYLNFAPPRIQWEMLTDKPTEVLVDQTYFVTGVGTVVSGTVMAGKVTPGSSLLLGPDSSGAFVPAAIKSIQCKKSKCITS